MKFLFRTAALAGVVLASVSAQAEELRVGWQQIVEPARVPQADGTFDKETGAEVSWSQFASGADVVAAIASGSIDIGYVGSSPLTAAASQELPISAIYIVGNIGEAEALAVKGVTDAKELEGKKIATPFASTAHYSLLSALSHWGIPSTSVQLLNLRPQEIAAAWERGDIDGAYIWDPVLQTIKTSGGTVLANSSNVAEWGSPTFDAWIVSKDYAAKHPEIVTAFVKVLGNATADYLADPDKWSTGSAEVEAIARLTGAKADDVPLLLKGYTFADLNAQTSAAYLGGGTAKALADTAQFLASQGTISAALPDYTPYVDASFAEAAKD